MSLEDLKTKASELFEVGPSILIQRFDKDFEELVGVEQYSEIQNSNKLKVIVHEKQQKKEQKQRNKIKIYKSFQTVGENILI